MNQWLVILRKEQLELWRSYKWIWVPLVFVLLGIMQPVTTYFLPQILESAGGLPEGTIIQLPTPTGNEVMIETIGQFNTIGILVLVLAFMGIVSGERSSGVASLVLVKPVPYLSYITAKWFSAIIVTIASLILGTAVAAMYTDQLFDGLQWSAVLQSLGLLVLWFAFIMTLTVCFSTILKAQAAAAFATLLCAVGLTLLSSMLQVAMRWSPGSLMGYTASIIASQPATYHMWLAAVVTCVGIGLLLAVATKLLQHQELAP